MNWKHVIKGEGGMRQNKDREHVNRHLNRDVKKTENGITELKYAFEGIKSRVGSL